MKRNNKKGFTLVELVIVIAVIAILAGVMIATFSNVVSDAQASADLQEIKSQIDTAYLNFIAKNGNPSYVSVNKETNAVAFYVAVEALPYDENEVFYSLTVGEDEALYIKIKDSEGNDKEVLLLSWMANGYSVENTSILSTSLAEAASTETSVDASSSIYVSVVETTETSSEEEGT